MAAAPFLLGDGVDVPDDALYYAVPAWEWLAEAARQGVSPFWVPGKLGGVSLFADVVPMGPFYPFAWLGLVLPVVPALGLAAAIHAVGTLFAVAWLAKGRGAAPVPAALAGAAIVAGPLGVAAFVDAQVDAWPTFLWLPVVLGCLDRSDRGLRWLAGAAGALALLLLGSHLRLSVAACGLLGLWALLRGRQLLPTVAALGVGVMAGAPGWLPMALEARLAKRGGMPDLLVAVDQGLGLHALGGWVTPSVFVVARDVGLGAVLALGLVAAVRRERWRELTLLAVLLLAGSKLPGVGVLLAPLLVLTHPINLVYPVLALIPAAALAAVGLTELLAAAPTERVRRLRPVGAVVGGALALATLHALGVLGAPHSPTGRVQAALGVLQAAAVAGGAAWLLSRPGRAVAAWALLALGLVDLGAYALRAHDAVPATPLRSARVAAVPADALAAGFLDAEDLARGWDSALAEAEAEEADPLLADDPERAAGTRPRRLAVEGDVQAPEVDGPRIQADLLGRAFAPHAPMAFGVAGLAGRSKLAPARQQAAVRPLAEALHDTGALSYVMQDLFGRADGLGARTAALFGLGLAGWGSELVFAQTPPPRCFAATELAVEPDLRRRVERALATPWPGSGPALVEEALPPPAPARVDCSTDAIAVDADGEALIVLQQAPHPGWRIRDEAGRALPTVPVHQVRTGVRVGPGPHVLTARFEPPGLRAALSLALLGWLAIGLGLRRPRSPATLALLSLLLAPAAFAAPIEGRVLGRDAAGQQVWLIDELDLTSSRQPVATARVAPDGTFSLPAPAGDGRASWLLLHQMVDDAPPQRFVRPLDLDPFAAGEPPPAPTLRAIPAGLARIRAAGRPMPGYWLQPLLLALLFGGGGWALKAAFAWRRQAGEGARTLITALRSGAAAAEADRRTRRQQPAAPRADQATPPVQRWEQGVLGALLALGAALRLRGFGAPLDLLEWTYGPGTRPIRDDALPFADAVLQAIVRPPSVEVTHPPGYHLLLGLLGEAEPLLRAPALLASLATIAGVWWLVRRLDVRAALFAAATVAVASPAQHFGRDASPYALAGLVSIAALLAVLRALETGRRAHWRLAVGVLVVGVLCHYAVALFGLPLIVGLVAIAGLRSRNPRWAAAGERMLGAGLLWMPLPLAWGLVHFAWFEPVALDTQLFADVYPRDPGLGTFARGLLAVCLGLPPTATLGALAGGLLAVRGVAVAMARDRVLGLLLALALASLAGSVVFFHGNLVHLLGGRIFWGFRWVCWALPLALACGALGAAAPWPGGGRLDATVRGLLALVWLSAALPFAADADAGSARPDYAAAAATIHAELADDDAVAALPLWGQRGPLRHYLVRRGDGAFAERDGVVAWSIGDRRVFLEPIDERLPFESSARNAFFDRLWVAVVDERMFGQPKFSSAVADRALAWADQRLLPDGAWSFDGVELRRYRRRPRDLALAAGQTRTITAPEVDLRSGPWNEPNAASCRSEEEGAEPRWLLQLRVPTAAPVEATVQGGQLEELEDAVWRAEVAGGPCSGPAPVVTLRAR